MNKVILSLFVITLFGSFADASVTILYEDNFDGNGAASLHGLVPDIDNYDGTNTWIAYEDWKADGTPAPLSSATLPFTPMPGKIYRLTTRFENVTGNGDWLALGFTTGSSSEQGSNDDRFISGDTAGQPWMLRRGDQATGDDQTFAGPGTLNSQDISNTLDRSLDVDFQITLDTRSTQWQSTWYQKLTSESEYYTVRNFTYSTNPSIEAVGLACANEGTTGDIAYFLLEELAVKQLIAHWTLDEADYDGNYYLDTVEGYVAQPANEPNFITGVRDEANGAVTITASSGWGVSEIFALDGTEGFSICFWVDWKGNWEQTADINDLIVESNEPETEYVVTNGLKANQRWQHICVTYDNSNLKVYLNGVLKLSEAGKFQAGSEAVIEIGNSLSKQIFNGDIDDIRLYDYPLSQTEITQLVTGEENCTGEYGLEFDFTGPYGVPDCIVDLFDLEEFTYYWLDELTPYGMGYDFSGPGGESDGVVNFYDLAVFSAYWLESGLQAI